MEDLVERDGLHYKKFTDVPFTGEVTSKGEGSFKDGKEDGPWVYYYRNGQVVS
jgi:antitoxin component YwqK of YwqJK toxin-antitoxin module